jgi:hypothetical protein
MIPYDDFAKQMYQHHLDAYQNRYVMEMVVTWGHISHWRKWASEYGKVMIEAGIITPEQHRENMAFVAGAKVIDIAKRQKEIDDATEEAERRQH